jgi:hypothetical protein
MSDEIKGTLPRYVIKLTPGKSGVDPNAPDWEVWEIEGEGEGRDPADVYDNLTQEEARNLAGMWSRKRDEANPT